MATESAQFARRERPLPIRAHPIVLGTVIFLASELMFFSALFATYYDLKSTSAVWPPRGVHHDQLGTAAASGLLFIASLVMFPFMRCVRRDSLKAARAWLYTSILAGIGFLIFELRSWAKEPTSMWTDAYSSTYFTMTGFHYLHVVAGIILLTGLYIALRSPAVKAESHAAAEAISYYWHFVFIVWVGIYATIFLVH